MRLEDVDDLLVFGGSFDPPQWAHVKLPFEACEAVGGRAVAYVPAARSPHKLDHQPAPAEHRLAMLRLALKGRDNALVLTDELDRAADGRPSYTVETLEELRSRLPAQARLRLLIGADQFRSFDRWHRPERIVELAELLVMLRPPETIDTLHHAWPKTLAENRQRVCVAAVSPIDVSSTQIRQRVAAGQWASLTQLAPPAVVDYIREHRLYHAAP